MNLDIGAKRPIDGTHVFLVGKTFSSAEKPFVLLYDPSKKRRAKRNIQGIQPSSIVEALGMGEFTEIHYPSWGTVWFRSSRIRRVRELTHGELATSPAQFGSLVLFEHDPEPEDEHAGFFLFGMAPEEMARRLVPKPSGPSRPAPLPAAGGLR